jgi:flagellar motility protein MotE (MotC chaperone)
MPRIRHYTPEQKIHNREVAQKNQQRKKLERRANAPIISAIKHSRYLQRNKQYQKEYNQLNKAKKIDARTYANREKRRQTMLTGEVLPEN